MSELLACRFLSHGIYHFSPLQWLFMHVEWLHNISHSFFTFSIQLGPFVMFYLTCQKIQVTKIAQAMFLAQWHDTSNIMNSCRNNSVIFISVFWISQLKCLITLSSSKNGSIIISNNDFIHRQEAAKKTKNNYLSLQGCSNMILDFFFL